MPRDEKICDYCKSIVCPVPEKYWLNGKDYLITKDDEKLLREELVKTAPEFDEKLFNSRDGDLAKRNAETQRALDIAFGRTKPISNSRASTTSVACPYCKSPNVSKISTVGRAASVGIFGLASKKIGKQWHCKKCGSDF